MTAKSLAERSASFRKRRAEKLAKIDIYEAALQYVAHFCEDAELVKSVATQALNKVVRHD